MAKSLWGCLLATIAIWASGCGGDGRPDLIEAKGTVKVNGEPVADAVVSFKPIEGNEIKRPSRAKTDAQGNFTLGTYGAADGVPVGKYKVGIEKKQLVGELPPNYDPETPNATPLKYEWITPREVADPDTSGLEAEVTDDGLVPPVFDLQRPGKPEIETQGGKPARPANEP